VIADTNITFTATAPYNPTYTWERSTDNGATWTTVPGATTSTLTIPSVDMTWNQNRFRAVAVDQFGRIITSNTAILTVSIWGPLDYRSGWADYNTTTYAAGQYTKTSAGLVALKGLVKDGTASWDTPIAVLPVGYRPPSRLIFYVGSYDTGANRSSGFGRVDVLSNGEVRFMSGTNTWVSLDSIRFMAAGSTCTASATITPLLNSWQNYAGYDPLSVCRDTTGRISTKGLVFGGNSALGTQIGAMPAGYQSTENRIVPAADSTGNFGSLGIYSYATGFVARGMLTSYLSANNLYIANNGAVTWNTPAVVNSGWVNYNNGFATLQYGKTSDNMVMLKGLVAGGTASPSADTVLFTLPSGYRPDRRLLFSGVANQAHARIDVDKDGDVIFHSGAHSNWTSLDAISFYADGS
jgi:hypothetical protein